MWECSDRYDPNVGIERKDLHGGLHDSIRDKKSIKRIDTIPVYWYWGIP